MRSAVNLYASSLYTQGARVFGMLVLIAGVLSLDAHSAPARGVESVHFRSGDGQTDLVGYLFRPAGPGPHAAIVMLHGRGGPYSSLAKGTYNADTLSKRHKFWGEFWAGKGYVALLVDSFGPRGYWRGFPKNSYEGRPSEVSEQRARLRRSQPGQAAQRIQCSSHS
jgi:dienelactone hydrolase